MLKLKMMLYVMMLPLVVVWCAQNSLSVSATPYASGVDNAASPPTNTAGQVISPSERADHYAKTTGRNPEVY